MWHVYILECEDGSLYTGITTDVGRRFAMHQSGTGAKYTRARIPKAIVYSEDFPDRSSASIREAEVKKMRREDKIRLISGGLKNS